MNPLSIGTVISDEDSPTFELIRIHMAVGHDVKPGTLIKVQAMRNGETSTLIGRVQSAYEHNPNENVESANVRKKLSLSAHYPHEEDSTTIFRLVEADLIEEIVDISKAGITRTECRSPQTLPNSGAEVFIADEGEIVRTLGLTDDEKEGLYIGETISGTKTKIIIKREAIQRHMFICGTTGSGKSYAMGVVAEELISHGLPIVFIDTQDEYSNFVKAVGGQVVEPGKDFTVRISSLTEGELLDLFPDSMKKSPLQCDIALKAFGDLQTALHNGNIEKFTLQQVFDGIQDAASSLCAKEGDVLRVTDSVTRRMGILSQHKVFGQGIEKAHWPTLMSPCLSINCKRLTSIQLQSVATAVLRELQNYRLKGHIPPYVVVIDEAHLFVPQGHESSCKQIIAEGVRIGRHHGICMILLTQSPVDIDKSIIRQCNTRLVFALEPDQLDAIRGVKADASEEMLRALPKMPRGVCLLSGTYESVKHTIPVGIRERNMPNVEGGKAPLIFDQMRDEWNAKIAKAKQYRGQNGA